ncbi:MAG TPA: cytochrome c [Cytophagales bacterium]
MLPAEKIDHGAKSRAAVEATVSPEYGACLAVSCSGCHGENFGGGPSPVPGFPPIPNITSAGHPGKWTEAEFIKTLRTGLTLEGKRMKNAAMLWQMTSQYTDLELKALRAYLLTLPGNGNLARN